MKFIADFHIHSHYSRATSRDLTPENLDYFAGIKGIKVIGTGDFTHPGWLKELKEKLLPAEDGLYRLKDEYRLKDNINLNEKNETRFILTSEISNIYKKNDKVRKVHNVILAPDFETVYRIQAKLEKSKFNITSDGRPILGLDAKYLLEMMLEISEEILFVPAHIWTPWFSVLGEKSGFDRIEECFEDLTKYIYALETGLSSDPPMNYLCSFLDEFRLLSNSDAHSPDKIGRNANMFDTDLSYAAVTGCLRNNTEGFIGTIDMFPQEGKYHYDGHRNCKVVLDPLETLENNYNCPECGKRLTIGVMHRVTELSDRNSPDAKSDKKKGLYIIPLKEIIGEITGTGVNSIAVANKYNSLIEEHGNEFNLLLFKDLDEIKKSGDMIIYEAIRRMRNDNVIISEGYDGEYGRIKLFSNDEEINSSGKNLFGDVEPEKTSFSNRKIINFDLERYHELIKNNSGTGKMNDAEKSHINENNIEQQKAIEHLYGPMLIIAGPGTGKTYTLTNRILNIIINHEVNPKNILAVTFTNKASDEMKERLQGKLSEKDMPQVNTFHSFGYSILKKYFFLAGRKENFGLLNDSDRNFIITKVLNGADASKILKFISDKKQEAGNDKMNYSEIYEKYEKYLEAVNCFDLDDLVYKALQIFDEYPEIKEEYSGRFKWLFIDEYQDINSAQYKLMRHLTDYPDPNICAIGDPNQSIYGFRGSDVKFIGQFVIDYRNAVIYKLDKSYRCPDNILKAGDDVIGIENGIHGTDKMDDMFRKVKIKIVEHRSSKSEAEFIARTIERMIGGTSFFSMDSDVSGGNEDPVVKSLSDIAILCRIKELFSDLEKALNDHRIPYRKSSQDLLMDNKTVDGIINIMKYIYNPEDKFAGFKIKAIYGDKFIIDGSDIIGKKNMPVRSILDEIIKKYYGEINDDEMSNGIGRLIEISERFGNELGAFINFIVTGMQSDMLDMKAEFVKLMTIHAAKGLEFNTVFIPGCEEGIIPFNFFDANADLAEEKRILYVGLTRSQKNLYLSGAEKRVLYGREVELKRSGFLDKLKKDLYDFEKIDIEDKNYQPSLFKRL